MASNLYRLGWDERNGGNISYLLTEEEVSPYVNINKVIRNIPINITVQQLAGHYFILTGSGKYFKNVKDNPSGLSRCYSYYEKWTRNRITMEI